MAYPTVSAPYGLKPINLIGGQVFAGSTRLFQIASGYNTSIFYGDVVRVNSSGVIVKETGTTTVDDGGVVGVFLGCQYVNTATNQPITSQYFPANTAVTSGIITAFVADDPDQLFKVTAVSSGTTVAFYGRTLVGSNAPLVQNPGSATTGDSAVALLGASAATTNSLPLRIVDVVPDTANAAGNFCEFIVKFNAPYVTATTTFVDPTYTTTVVVKGGHQYLNPTGV